jgi:hypothetical protein
MYAAETGDYKTAEALLEKGVNPNITDKVSIEFNAINF